jgi:cation:H+ antiporter
MNIPVSVLLFVLGLFVVIYSAEKLVKGVVSTSIRFGISTFLISVIFIGFDPENLAVGATGSAEGLSGIALGSIIGAAMVAIGLAFGVTALVVPMKFEQVPKRILIVTILAVVLLGGLALDGELSRIDGAILLAGFVVSISYLVRLTKSGLDIKPVGEVAETIGEIDKISKRKSVIILLLSLIGIIIGSQALVTASETIIGNLGLSDTVFGMTILAFLVSIEELARELPAARKGRPEISFGNVTGSILAFFLMNAGIIALVRPIAVDSQTLRFYLPVCLGTVVTISLFMMTKRISRWAGGILIALYAIFIVGGYVGWGYAR